MMSRLALLLATALLATFVAGACSKESGKKGGGGNAPVATTKPSSAPSTTSDPCSASNTQATTGSGAEEDDEADDKENDEEADLTEELERDFSLAGSTYGDIKTLIDTKCGTCHPGVHSTDLKTFAGVSAKADAMLARMKAQGPIMPPSPTSPLSATEIAKFQAWITDGKKDVASSSTSSGTTSGATTGSGTDEGSTGGSSGSGGSDCDPPADDDFDDADDVIENEDLTEGLLFSQIRKDCNARSKTFYHKETPEAPEGFCEETIDLVTPCTRESIVAAFGNSGAAAGAKYDSLAASGYFIDQCGSEAGKGVFYMLCLHTGDKVCKPREQLKTVDSVKLSSFRTKQP